MTNAYEKAQSMGLLADIFPESDPPRPYTDAEIVAALQAIPRHHRNVYITGGPSNTESVNLLHLLTARHRVMGMGSAQQWVGPLIDLEDTNPTVLTVMRILRPLLQVNDTLVYCADSDDAANMLNALTQVVATLTGKPAQVAAEVALLSGGRIGADYADLTVEEFAAQRAAAEQQELVTELQAEWVAFLNETINPLLAAGNRIAVKNAMLAKAEGM
jgi:hypothetical protein